MAQWSGKKVNINEINNGNEYERKDRPTREQLNAIVNNSLYASNISENVSSQLAGLGADDRVEFKGSNPNLLINGDFRVNQRELSSYSGGRKYTVDRWIMGSGLQVDLLETSIRVTNNATSNLSFEQDYLYEEISNLLGKTLTFSVMETNGTLNTVTFTMPNQYPTTAGHLSNVINTSFGSIYVYASGGKVQFTIRMVAGRTAELKYAKLEIGNVATAFSPRPYAEELALCQKYYFTTGAITSKTMLLKAQSNYDFYQNFIFFPVQMRTNPTVTVYGGANGHVNSLPTRNDDSVRIAVTCDGTLGIGNGFLIYATNGNAVVNTQYRLNGVTADAEIY